MAKMANKSASQNGRRARWLLIWTLITAALILAAWRHLIEPQTAAVAGDRLWDVELYIEADATAGKTSVDIAVPRSTRRLRVIGQSINHPGWRQRFGQANTGGNARKITLISTRDGPQSAEVTFSVHASAIPGLTTGLPSKPLEGDRREAFLRDHPMLQIAHPEVSGFVERLRSSTQTERATVDAIYHQVRKLRERRGEGLLEVPDILVQQKANQRERAYTMVAVCRAARIPARLVKGIVLTETPNTTLHFWVEAYLDGQWVPFDPVYGYRQVLPGNYLSFVNGLDEVVAVSGSTSFTVGYGVSSADPLLDIPESTGNDWREILDLSRLSLDTRLALAPLLLLPFGVLLTTLFSETMGVRMYGVFTPSLLALSLGYVPWLSALLVLAIVLTLGVLGRSAMPGELKRGPRLAIVLTLVVLGIAASASLMEYTDLLFGGQLVLLPVVILTSLVDRFYSVLDDAGLHVALVRLGWTMAATVVCIPVVQFEALGHFMIRYPELHLVTLAAILALTLKGLHEISP